MLVIDELGFLPLDPDGAKLLFQVVSQAYERQTLVITTNVEFSLWGSTFGDDQMAGRDRPLDPPRQDAALSRRVLARGALVDVRHDGLEGHFAVAGPVGLCDRRIRAGGGQQVQRIVCAFPFPAPEPAAQHVHRIAPPVPFIEASHRAEPLCQVFALCPCKILFAEIEHDPAFPRKQPRPMRFYCRNGGCSEN